MGVRGLSSVWARLCGVSGLIGVTVRVLFATVCFGSVVVEGALPASAATEVESLNVPTTGWRGEGEFGFGLTRGNTDTQNVNIGVNLRHLMVKWENTYGFSALNESQSGKTSSERYSANFQANRKFGESNFLLGTATYDDDRFSGFDYEATASLGYGRRLVDQKHLQVDVEIGPGYRTTKLSSEALDRNESILRTAFKLRYELNDTARIGQTLTSTVGDVRSVTRSETSLTTQVMGNLAMKASFIVRYNTLPADAVNHKKDTESALTLVYKF